MELQNSNYYGRAIEADLVFLQSFISKETKARAVKTLSQEAGFNCMQSWEKSRGSEPMSQARALLCAVRN